MRRAARIAGTLARMGVLMAVLPAAAPLADAAAGAAVVPGRPGYVVGDIIERRVVVSALPGSVIEAASLPRPGPQSSWLTLNAASMRTLGGAPARYEIDLRYQLINAPTQVVSLMLPAFSVRYSGAGRPEVAIAGEPVKIAPLLPAHVPVSAAWVRPDRAPLALSSAAALAAAVASGSLAIAMVAVLLALPVLRRRHAPFARASRLLRRAVRRGGHPGMATEALYPSALRLVHRAFDQTAGWSLFPDRVADFLRQRRQFEDLRAGIERFLTLSQREFFESRSQEDPGNKGRDLRWLLEFTDECRARERQAS